MAKMRRHSYDDENQSLLNSKTTRRTGNHQVQKSSRLEQAESSYIRLLSILFWSWIFPVLRLGYKQELTENDLDGVPNCDKALLLLDRLNTYDWLSTTAFKMIMKEFWKDYILANLSLIPFLLVSIIQPLLLHQAIFTMADTKGLNTFSFIWLALLFLCIFIYLVFERQAIFLSGRIGVRVRNALVIVLYKRVLSLKSLSQFEVLNTGQIMNLIVNDVSKFEEMFSFLANACEAFLESSIMFGILCWIIHPIPILCSFCMLCIFAIVQLYLGRKFGQHRETTTKHSDQRIQVFTEFVYGYETVKMWNWEKSINDYIAKARNDEIKGIHRVSRLRAFNITQYFTSTSIFALFTFGTAMYLGYPLNAANICSALLSFALIRNNFMYSLTFASEKFWEAKFASKRIDAFMKLVASQESSSSYASKSMDEQKKGNITMTNTTFSWNYEVPCLSSLNLNIENGTLVGIIGPVGSGKSSLLAAILGEMKLMDGQINTNQSSFAYAAQSPWIFADTIRNNILLNRPFDELQYHKIIYACCLDVDFQLIGLSGDLTIVGDNGVNLSGGQKARISLARALYGEADIYLLDDPFSAVDRIVAKQIYERCIGEDGLLRNKTRLLVTHQVEFIAKAQQIISFSNGQISKEDCLNDATVNQNDNKKANVSTLVDMLDTNSSTADTQPIIVSESTIRVDSRWSIWYRWLTMSPHGIPGLMLLIVLLLLGESLNDAGTYWLSIWLQQLEENKIISSKFAYVYFGFILSTIFIDIIRTNYYFTVVLNGSNAFHNNMMKGLLYTPIEFFEINPIGRTLNRVSKDQYVIDEILPVIFLTGLITFLLVTGSTFIICIINPYIIILLIVLVMIIWWIIHFYQRCSWSLKRLESATRSPIYTLFSTSMNGLATIRSFKAEETLIESMAKKIDLNTSAYINLQGTSQWFAFTLSLICSLILLVTIIEITLFQNLIDSTKSAICITSSITLTIAFQWAIRRLSEANILMESGGRIYEYSYLPMEENENENKGLVQTSQTWPEKAVVDFKNYSLRHRSNLKYAIKTINLTIQTGQKIGIIGRTGSGKSSLFKGIFRLVNRSNVEGQILIDDVDISSIKLTQLRSNLTIIPQQPILFSGSLRYNLDPCNLYSDEECWKAINDVQLKSFVMNNPSGLMMPIHEFGKNLSAGQCQLISIARALLRKSKILLIDEATANVDQETDNLIQKVIREKFHDRTVLTIAHRLQTVKNCDRIIVLDSGIITAYDTPNNILQLHN